MRIAKRIGKLKPSATLTLDAKVKELQRLGVPIINLGLGEPDFGTPENIKSAGVEAIENGFTHYTSVAGIQELKEAIAKKFLIQSGISYKVSEIVVGVGSKQLLYNAFQVLCEENDEVIVSVPTWSTYIEQIKLAGGKPVFVSLKFPFKLTAKDLSKKITKRTKIILLNSPSNPTGAIIDRKELEKIADLAIKKNIFVISDEIYEKLVYDGEHLSIASFSSQMKNLTITINGFSKTYAMTGWRIGYAGGPQDVIDAMISLQGQTTSNTSSISQKAGLAAITGNQSYVKKMLKEYKVRRDYIVKELLKERRFEFTIPEGTFYLFVGIQKLLGKKFKSSEDWCSVLLEMEKVSIVPGEAFLAPGYFRLSFAASMKDIREGIKRIRRFVKDG